MTNPGIGLLSSEPFRAEMAGIGIRYVEMARHLSSEGFEVTLVAPQTSGSPPGNTGDARFRAFERGKLSVLFDGCVAVVAQGQLANDLLLEVPETPAVIDLYDPWLVENLHYMDSLGLDPFKNDHASWVLQMSRGDFFLCSSEEQRLFYVGFLTAMGRINPVRLRQDPELRGLIQPVPFGVAAELPAHRPYLDDSETPRLLFGGLYDWYDPWPLLEAVAQLDQSVELLFIRSANAESTPQSLFHKVETWCRDRQLWGRRVRALDWVPYERRYDLLRDVDALAVTYRAGLETDLSLRTRLLDAVAAGCPILTSEGGSLASTLKTRGVAWVVAPDPSSIAAALEEILAGVGVAERCQRGRELAKEWTWGSALAPLVEFLRSPRRDPTKEVYSYRPETLAPPDRLAFRLRRFLRSRLGGSRS